MMKPLAEQMVFRLPPETETAVDSLRQTYNNLCVFLFFQDGYLSVHGGFQTGTMIGVISCEMQLNHDIPPTLSIAGRLVPHQRAVVGV